LESLVNPFHVEESDTKPGDISELRMEELVRSCKDLDDEFMAEYQRRVRYYVWRHCFVSKGDEETEHINNLQRDKLQAIDAELLKIMTENRIVVRKYFSQLRLLSGVLNFINIAGTSWFFIVPQPRPRVSQTHILSHHVHLSSKVMRLVDGRFRILSIRSPYDR
jgi:hypothetical protein